MILIAIISYFAWNQHCPLGLTAANIRKNEKAQRRMWIFCNFADEKTAFRHATHETLHRRHRRF